MPTMTMEQYNFIQKWADLGGPVVRANGLPVSAMIACASVESGWGKGGIYMATRNPFSLQKWPHITYPRTYKTLWRDTIVQTNPVMKLKAPFNCALDEADAARQWCEWILHYGAADGPPQDQNSKAQQVSHATAAAARQALLGQRGNPVEFTRRLSTIGFGENRAKGAVYAQRLVNFAMEDFD